MWHMHLVFEAVWLLMALMCTPYCLRIAGTHEHTVLASLAKRSRMLSIPTRTVRLYLSDRQFSHRHAYLNIKFCRPIEAGSQIAPCASMALERIARSLDAVFDLLSLLVGGGRSARPDARLLRLLRLRIGPLHSGGDERNNVGNLVGQGMVFGERVLCHYGRVVATTPPDGQPATVVDLNGEPEIVLVSHE